MFVWSISSENKTNVSNISFYLKAGMVHVCFPLVHTVNDFEVNCSTFTVNVEQLTINAV